MEQTITAETLPDFSLESFFELSASRSGGAGGQNVNKVNTKVELRFNLNACTIFSDEQIALIYKKLANKINSEGQLVLVSQTHRTQLANKKAVIEKLYLLLIKALSEPKKRKPTKPSPISVEKRLEDKKARAELKKARKKDQTF